MIRTKTKYLPKLLRGILLAGTCLAAMMAQSPVFAQTDQVADQSATDDNEMTLEEVVVTGVRGAVLSAIVAKRDADSVIDAINAEDIGKFPDTNLAESLQRITGVQIARDGAEGTQISIRGMDPTFTRVTINGQAGGTSDPDQGLTFQR
jgi:iron complex outermembrane receptor protein